MRGTDLWNRLLTFFKPTRLEDPYFGSLLFMKAARGNQSYWEGSRLFSPLDEPVEVFIDALSDSTAPSQAQQDHFRWVENEYVQLCEAVGERFRADEWANEFMDNGFQSEFTLSSMSVPLSIESNETWELSFDAKRDGHLFSITFIGREPTSKVTIDG